MVLKLFLILNDFLRNLFVFELFLYDFLHDFFYYINRDFRFFLTATRRICFMKNETQMQPVTKDSRNEIVSDWRDDNDELVSLRHAAEQGDADAQFRLAEFYYKRYEDCCGAEEELEEAVRWYQEAAGRGDARAQFEIGWFYQSGEVIGEDHEKAVAWYRISAEQGYARAQYWLGWFYRYGCGVDPDMEEAVKWYGIAAEQGNEEALEDLIELGLIS